MRTRMLLTAATLAACAISAVAQSNVYSLNIVGYVNVPLNTPGNKFTAIANQFQVISSVPVQATNKADQVLAPVMDASKDGDSFQFWAYSGLVGYFQKFIIDSGVGTYGIADAGDNDIPNYADIPTLDPGKGFMYQPQGSSMTQITFVGEIPGPFPATFTYGLAASPRFTMTAGAVPKSGNLVTDMQFPVSSGDGTSVQFWSYSGLVGYWDKYIYDDQGNTGDPQWYYGDDATIKGALILTTGQAMMVATPDLAVRNWIQTVP